MSLKDFGKFVSTYTFEYTFKLSGVPVYKLKELAMELKFPEKKIAMAHVGVNLNRFNPKKSGKEIRKKYKTTIKRTRTNRI